MLDKGFFIGMMKAAQAEAALLAIRHARQEGVISFCEIIIKKLEENENDRNG